MSAQSAGRLAGLLWLLTIIFGVFAEFFVRSFLIVSGDPAATATKIAGGPGLWRLSIAADLLGMAAYLGMAAILTGLARPAVPLLARAAFALAVVGAGAGAAKAISQYAALFVLEDPAMAAAFAEAQRQGLMRLFLRLHSAGYGVALIFFSGLFLPLLGLLVFRAGLLPRTLGWLFILAGLCYLLQSFSFFVAPAFGRFFQPWAPVLFLLTEGGATLWLLLFGARESRVPPG